MNSTKAARNKRHAQTAARAAGQTQFAFPCAIHGPEALSDTQHGWCIECRAMAQVTREAKEAAKAVTIAAYRAAHPEQLREQSAASTWRTVTGGTLPASYASEREALQALYGACREGFEIDHAVAKVSKDGKRQHVASGLHCVANLVETPTAVNRMKATQFAPDTNRLQRPANRGPGGAFDPAPTQPELELIDNAAYEGTPAAVSLQALREALDAQARAYEAHVSETLGLATLAKVAA